MVLSFFSVFELGHGESALSCWCVISNGKMTSFDRKCEERACIYGMRTVSEWCVDKRGSWLISGGMGLDKARDEIRFGSSLACNRRK